MNENIYRQDNLIFKSFISVLIFLLIPFVADVFKMKTLIAQPDVTGYSIASQMEWFDLINETLQAFLVIPLYRIFTKFRQSIEKHLSGIICFSFSIYILFSVIVIIFTNNLTKTISGVDQSDIGIYLKLETVGFIFNFLSSIALVYFVANREFKLVWISSICKVAAYSISYYCLVPLFGVNGVAYGNITINGITGIVFFIVIIKRRVLCKPNFCKEIYKSWFKIGIYQGTTILLNNLAYTFIVCKLINNMGHQAEYWAINNVIWGLLLIPFLSMTEMLQTDIKSDAKTILVKWRHLFIITYSIWLVAIIFAPYLLEFLTGLGGEILNNSFRLLLVYYVTFGLTSLFDALLVARGQTKYNLFVSIVVNIFYYGVVYVLYISSVLQIDFTTLINIFGIGMVVHLICDLVIFRKEIFNKNSKK